MDKAEKYTRAEYIHDSKIQETTAESSGPPKKWGKQNMDKRKEPQVSRLVNTGYNDRNPRPPRSRFDWFDSYTPLRFPPNRMLEIASKQKLLQPPT